MKTVSIIASIGVLCMALTTISNAKTPKPQYEGTKITKEKKTDGSTTVIISNEDAGINVKSRR